MPKKLMINLLKRANNGSDLLQILDSLTEDNQQSVAYAEPTADVIDF